MRPLVFRCVAKHSLGGRLDDMPAPVQVHFEPVGLDVIAMLNRRMPFSPVLPAGEAAQYESGATYAFHVSRIDGSTART